MLQELFLMLPDEKGERKSVLFRSKCQIKSRSLNLIFWSSRRAAKKTKGSRYSATVSLYTLQNGSDCQWGFSFVRVCVRCALDEGKCAGNVGE